MKFKVGERYKVKEDGLHSEKGNVIEIEKVEGIRVCYKTIKGKMRGISFFDKGSAFANMLEPVKNECIVICRKGKETIALDKSTGKTGVAKCCPQDEYDFYTGAKLAFERLTGTEPAHVNCRCSLVTEVKREAQRGEYIKIKNCDWPHDGYEDNDIIYVSTVSQDGYVKGINKRNGKYTCSIGKKEYVVLEGYTPEQPKKDFKPYLTYCGKNYGYIGESTPIKDVIGRELKVGDTVELYDKRKNNRGEVVIAFEDGKYFVMGIESSCNNDGTIERDWKIIKKRGYEEIANGERVDDITYIKEV